VYGRVSHILVRPPGGTSTDVNNSSPTLRHRRTLGLPILTDFVGDGDVWRGRIYYPRRGRRTSLFIQRQTDGTLKVQGCIALFCQTQIWTRVA
jgi:uncharacterized protein (DUF2147 family)